MEAEVDMSQIGQQMAVAELWQKHTKYVEVTDARIHDLEEAMTIRTHALALRAINIMRVDMIQNVLLIILIGVQIYQFFR